MKLAASTAKSYRHYLERWERDGRPDPEAWLDGMPSLGSAHVARSALRWAFDLDLQPRKQSYHVPVALTHEELAEVRSAAAPMELDTINALYYSGARIGELLRMQASDIRNGSITIHQTKGRVGTRLVPLHPEFPVGLIPHRYGRDWAEKHLREVGRAVGLRLYPHLLRATFATHLLVEGVDVRTVQVLLGHTSVELTMQYLATTESRMKDAVSVLS